MVTHAELLQWLVGRVQHSPRFDVGLPLGSASSPCRMSPFSLWQVNPPLPAVFRVPAGGVASRERCAWLHFEVPPHVAGGRLPAVAEHESRSPRARAGRGRPGGPARGDWRKAGGA